MVLVGREGCCGGGGGGFTSHICRGLLYICVVLGLGDGAGSGEGGGVRGGGG